MRYFYGLFPAILLLSFLSITTFAQDFNGDWTVEYVTDDNAANGTGVNTISATVTSEDNFVALVNRGSYEAYYLVGYRNATSSEGRLGVYPYGSAATDKKTLWVNGFDQVFLNDPLDLASYGDLVFVTNNDQDYNILLP